MKETLRIRTAVADEYGWINARYAQVDFMPSVAGHGMVMVASVDGCDAGLGRLTPVGGDAAELGGMLVFDGFRGRGIAHRLVAALLQAGGAYRSVYCLPFSHLHAFYRQHGFADVAEQAQAPQAILDKHRWCNSFYPGRSTLLLVREQPAPPAHSA